MLMSAFLGIVASPEVKVKTLSNKHPHYTFPQALHNYSPQLEVVGGVEGGRSYIYEGKVAVAPPYYWAYVNAITNSLDSLICDSK